MLCLMSDIPHLLPYIYTVSLLFLCLVCPICSFCSIYPIPTTHCHISHLISTISICIIFISLSLCLSSRSLIIILSSKNLGISIGRGSISLTLSASLDSRSLFLSKIFPGRSHSPTLHGLCLPLFPPFLYLLLLCQCDWPLI